MNTTGELAALEECLLRGRQEGKSLVALLYGSLDRGTPHVRSDIDLGLLIRARDEREEMELVDEVLMAVDRQVSILRLDDEDESPFVIQEALKGTHLIEPDRDALYAVANRVLHQCEEIRFRKELKDGTHG